MKNLFKSLMLVAVAAMTFTACSEKNNDDVKATQKKVALEFTAGFAEDTRVAFGEKNENAYPTLWEAGDVVTISYDNRTTTYTLAAGDILEGGKSANIVAEFTLEADQVLAASGNVTATVGTEFVADNAVTQNGAKPAHYLKASANYPTETVLNFEHEVAYGKMTIEGLDDVELETVELTLTGAYGASYACTIDATDVTDNVFWFVTKPFSQDYSGSGVLSFTVVATDKDGNSYGKEVKLADLEGERKLYFETGSVTAFSVSELGSDNVPEEINIVFTKAEYNSDSNRWKFSNDKGEYYDVEFYPDLKVGTYTFGSWMREDYTYDPNAGLYAPDYGFENSGSPSWCTTGNDIVVTEDGGTYTITFDLVGCVPAEGYSGKAFKATYEGTL
ncbi:MAG: hypothetical protein E7146_06005 [Rikenellaceae bacterium]|nr:hypothetical protein [Rikenellaceae bacterium]